MAKTLQAPHLVKDVDGIAPFVKDEPVQDDFDELDELDDLSSYGELEEIEDYGAVGAMTQDEALEGATRERAALGGTDPVRDFKLADTIAKLRMMGDDQLDLTADADVVEIEDYPTAGAKSFAEAEQNINDQLDELGGTDPVRDFQLRQQLVGVQAKAAEAGATQRVAEADTIEIEDYETAGGMSVAEAQAGLKNAMKNAPDMQSYGAYAMQAAALDQMQAGFKAEGDVATFDSYSTPLSGGGSAPTSKVLGVPKMEFPKPLVESIAKKDFLQAINGNQSKQLADLPKIEDGKNLNVKPYDFGQSVSENKNIKNVKVPVEDVKKEPGAEQPNKGRALPDLSGLKASHGSRSFELD